MVDKDQNEASVGVDALKDEERNRLDAFLRGTKTPGVTGVLGIKTESGVADKRYIIINYCELHKWCDKNGRFSNQEAKQIVEKWYPDFFKIDSE
ncbi:MAG: hypothetical protein HZA34_04360 [Candidatus Pacebacteria bacterium]|nr:hypothetical protein [Candidatus Paceibacterota bacterium]